MEAEVEITEVVETKLDIVAFVVVPNTAVVECGAVLGIGVVGHGLECVSISQEALHNAT